MHLHHIGLASPVMAMDAFVEKFRAWIETVVGCASAETMTLQCKFPFSHLVLEQLLADVNFGSAVSQRRRVAASPRTAMGDSAGL